MADTRQLERNKMLAVRTYEDTVKDLKRVTELMSERLGTKLTQAQALEILLSETVKRYESEQQGVS